MRELEPMRDAELSIRVDATMLAVKPCRVISVWYCDLYEGCADMEKGLESRNKYGYQERDHGAKSYKSSKVRRSESGGRIWVQSPTSSPDDPILDLNLCFMLMASCYLTACPETCTYAP